MNATFHEAVDRWLRDTGGHGPPDDAAAEHLRDCASCRAALTRRESLRTRMDSEHGPMDERRADAMRFALQAAARTSKAPASRSRRPLYLSVAAASVTQKTVGAWWVTRPDRSSSDPRLAATVEAGPDTQFQHTSGPPNQRYELFHGRLALDVPPLGGGQLEVVVGHDRVTVHGTRFTVVATEGRLESVQVAEGLVAIRRQGAEVIWLRAGERWDRPDPPAPVTASVEPEPERAPEPAQTRRTPRQTTGDSRDLPNTDERFSAAWESLNDGRPIEAAERFDELLRERDVPRRADVLYWSAEAHRRVGHRESARERLEELVRHHPDAWHAQSARRMLAEGD